MGEKMMDDNLLFAADLNNPDDVEKLKEIFCKEALDEAMEKSKGDTHEFMRILKEKIWRQKMKEKEKTSVFADIRIAPYTKQKKLF